MKARFFFVFKWLCIAALLCLLYGFFVEPRLMKTRHVDIQSSGYTGTALRIAHVSDIHIGAGHVTANRIQDIVAKVNAEKPDIVFITGDFIGGHEKREYRSRAFNTEADAGIAYLSGFKAPLGTYASLGNHDTWYGKTVVKTMLEGASVTVLDNWGVNIDETLCVVGLADFDTDVADTNSFNDCAEGMPIIVITHSPDSFRYLRSDTALALAGHTHGGQINLPFLGRAVTSTRAGKKYAYGRIEVQGIPAFVTSGIGTSILHARFRSPPEIAIITLSGTD